MLNSSERFWNAASVSLKIANKISISSYSSKTFCDNELQSKNSILKLDADFQENIKNVSSEFYDSTLLEVFEFLLSDLYESSFEESSIFVPSIHTSISNVEIVNLTKINLKYHTFEVFNIMCRITNETLGSVRDYLLILALVHDYGKSDILMKKYNISNEDPAHHKKSAKYLLAIVNIYSSKLGKIGTTYFETAIDALRVHHDRGATNKEIELQKKLMLEKHGYVLDEHKLRTFFLNFLKDADSKQREIELLYFHTLKEDAMVKKNKEN